MYATPSLLAMGCISHLVQELGGTLLNYRDTAMKMCTK